MAHPHAPRAFGALDDDPKSSSSAGRTPSSSELAAEAEAKRRKVQRACDVCRRKKIRCEGPMNSNSANKCANCQEYNLECTYVEAAKRRGPPKGYIDTLEQRARRLERLITQLHPGFDVNGNVGPMPDRDEFDLQSYQDHMRSLGIPPYPNLKPLSNVDAHAPCVAGTPPTAAGAPSPNPRVLGPAPWQPFEKDPHRPAEDAEDARDHERIAHAMRSLNVRDYDAFRFHGKASSAHLIRIVNELKYSDADLTFFDRLSSVKRSEYWLVPEWEKVLAVESVKPVDYSMWPDEALAAQLIDTFFEETNTHMPLLNRVLFQKQYDSGLWRTNVDFAKLSLMVFANGARYVDDERVYWPTDAATTDEGRERLRNDRDGTRKYSAGWIYLRAVHKIGRSWLQGPSLLDLQATVLGCLFLNGSAVPHLGWLVAGGGLRMAQEIGVHVRNTMTHINSVDRALYNRAFWCLYHFDRLSCSAIGRSVAIQDSDFDADYPIQVNDEFWDTGDPETDFKQPAGVPVDPSILAFTQMLKLDHILSAALRTIYAIQPLPEHGPDQRSIVVELDSALNAWADAVPDGLRWDPTRADPKLFEHSAILYAHYYYVQILIHRPFIPTRKHPESVGFPSLAICSNAARSISNILDAVLRRGRTSGKLPGRSISIAFALPASTAAIVLLMNVYAVRQRPQERERCSNDVRRVIAALKEMELTYRQAGKMTDLISEVARESTGAADFPPFASTPPKRAHDELEPDGMEEYHATAPPGAPDAPPLFVAAAQHLQQHVNFTPGQPLLACMEPAAALPPGGTPPTATTSTAAPEAFPVPTAPADASDQTATAPPRVPTPPYMNYSWGPGMTPTGESALVPDSYRPAPMPGLQPDLAPPGAFDAGDLQNLNYAVTNFDMLGDPNAPDFWSQIFRGADAAQGVPVNYGSPRGANGTNPSTSGVGVGVDPGGSNLFYLPWIPPDSNLKQ